MTPWMEPKETRSLAQLREHYAVEKELADRLKNATADQRRLLYGVVYDELFSLVHHHPQTVRALSPDIVERRVTAQLWLLRPFLGPGKTFLEVGPGDCSLSLVIAQRVQRVCGLDVSRQGVYSGALPPNVELISSDGVSVPLPASSVDIAYSNQVMEHIHPDDAAEHISGIWRVLRAGGTYICVTPNRLNGPHDISKHFDVVATGLHLREYTSGELADLFRKAGFRKVETVIKVRGRLLRGSVAPVVLMEKALGSLPTRIARLLAMRRLLRAILGVRLVATK